MSSILFSRLRLSIFGQSHSEGIGAVLDGLPPGEALDLEALQRFLERRAPGRWEWSTDRREPDIFEILSGLKAGRTCGAPLAVLIRNKDARPADYEGKAFRPGHGDYTAGMRYGDSADLSGGGHLSGRLTAPLCLAGGICLQILARRGVRVGAHILSIEGIWDESYDPVNLTEEELLLPGTRPFPVLREDQGDAMVQRIRRARAAGDSVGGLLECCALGVPAGLGDPMFDGMENRIARLAFAVPGVKGVEFGAGFSLAKMRGSAANDPFLLREGRVICESNHAGGILGGITTGMPLILRAAIKPTPSVALPQRSVSADLSRELSIKTKGRHDPCILPRAVPVLEAVLALAVLDAMMEKWGEGNGT